MGKILEGKSKPRICFVAHFTYGAMAGDDSSRIGGVERPLSRLFHTGVDARRW